MSNYIPYEWYALLLIMDSFIRIFEEDDEADEMDSFIRILKD